MLTDTVGGRKQSLHDSTIAKISCTQASSGRSRRLSRRRPASPQILVERDDILLNSMTFIPVNSAKFPQVHCKEAMQFVDWPQSREAQIIIRNFGKRQVWRTAILP
jgi:tungstate transport system substrate-binding protein